MPIWKLAIGLVLVVGAGAIALAFTPLPQMAWQTFLSYWTTNDPSDVIFGIVKGVVILAAVRLIVFNFRAIRQLLRSGVEETDAQIIGKWYVYRYGKKHGTLSLMGLNDEWHIRRTLGRTYAVRIDRPPNTIKITGRVVYKERDRLNILVTGSDHKQQSLISFHLTIPTIKEDGAYDSRLLGISVGDDSDYVLSARVYFACKAKLPKAYVESVIEAATDYLRTGQGTLLQMPASAISEIFKSNPLPHECRFEQKQPLRHRFWSLCARMIPMGAQPSRTQ
jgi:hypothetical protein